MIGFADSTIATSALVERDHMINVSPSHSRREIHNKRWFAVEPERTCGKQGTFNAMFLLFFQYSTRRHMSVALLLPIHGKCIEKVLDLDRRRKLEKSFVFLCRQPRLHACEPLHRTRITH